MVRPISFSLPVGTLISTSIAVYTRNFVPFTTLSVIILAPWMALLGFVSAAPAAAESYFGTSGTAAYLPVLLLGLLQAVLGFVMTGAITYGVVQEMNGTRKGIGDLIAAGFQSLLRVLLVSIVVGLIVGIGTLMLLVPGIVASIILYVALPAAVIEQKGVGEAMRRSADLTSGSRWPIFGAVFLVQILLAGIGLVGAYALTSTTAQTEAPVWFQILVAVLMTPFASTMGAVCYVLLRQGKENTNAQAISAVFS